MTDPAWLMALDKIGAPMIFALSALGSALGIGAAGPAAVGAWKKCFANNKAAPFLLVVFVGAPITQTFYGMIAMFHLLKLAKAATAFTGLCGWGLFGGLAIALSAWGQGKIGAGASDAQAETGEGFANYLVALGIIESVAIFVMVFTLVAAG